MTNPCKFEVDGKRCKNDRVHGTDFCQDHLAIVVRNRLWSGRVGKKTPCIIKRNGVRCKNPRVKCLTFCQGHLTEYLNKMAEVKADPYNEAKKRLEAHYVNEMKKQSE